MSQSDRKVIAIAGAGDLGRYVCEALLESPSFAPIILTRGVSLSSASQYQLPAS